MVAPLALLGITAATQVVGNLVDSLTGSGATAAAAKPAASASPDKIRKTADDFESVFLENAFGRLTENTGPDGPLGAAGAGGSVYRDMLTKEYAGQVTKSGGVGIGDAVYKQLLKLQEGSRAGA